MFITQETRNLVPLVPNFDVEYEGKNVGEPTEKPAYPMNFSDISDEEAFDIPCSQVQKQTGEGRCVCS